MSKTLKAMLDGIEFEIPALNIGQLEKVSEVLGNKIPGQVGLGILRISLERATPKADLQSLSPTVDEVATVVQDIMALSGLQKPDANPPQAPQ